MSHSPKTWAFRLLGGTLAAVVAVPVLGFLGVAGVVLWAVNVSIPNHQREITEAEEDLSRQAAATAEKKLTIAASDGRLTNEEIYEAVGGPVWDLQDTDPVWVLRARFEGTNPICFSFDITTPLSPATQVQATELPTCPPDLP